MKTGSLFFRDTKFWFYWCFVFVLNAVLWAKPGTHYSLQRQLRKQGRININQFTCVHFMYLIWFRFRLLWAQIPRCGSRKLPVFGRRLQPVDSLKSAACSLGPAAPPSTPLHMLPCAALPAFTLRTGISFPWSTTILPKYFLSYSPSSLGFS